MASPILNLAVARAAERLPVLKRLPLARLVIIAQVAMLAKEHFERLSPNERRRLMTLFKDAQGRPANMAPRERDEFQALVAKLEPKLFAQTAAAKFSPFSSRSR